MVGDYFKCTDPTPFRITEITEEYVYGDDGFKVDVGDLQPIPLTAEILKKNFPDPEILVWYGDKDKWHIECFTVEIKIKYVHQLQHLLNLLEIEKQIVL